MVWASTALSYHTCDPAFVQVPMAVMMMRGLRLLDSSRMAVAVAAAAAGGISVCGTGLGARAPGAIGPCERA